MSDRTAATGDSAISLASPCPCTSGKLFGRCCQPIHAGALAPTAEVLMRSRYTAFVVHNAHYLRYSWHPDTRPARIDFDPAQRWLGLKIKRREAGLGEDHSGMICFAARYKIAGRGHRLEECSRFIRLFSLPSGADEATEVDTAVNPAVISDESAAGRWVYVDGEIAGEGRAFTPP